MSKLVIDDAGLDRYIAACRNEYESALRTLVETPTVSADPARTADVRRGATLAADLLRRCGGEAQIVETGGHPLVLGRLSSGNAHGGIAVYNHLDVQPAEEPEWQHDPFRLHIDGERYMGRGTTDDKGPALAALFAARYAVQHGATVDVHFIWEFEEEIGSPHFDTAIAAQAKRLPVDAVLVSDTVWIAQGIPAIAYGLRGLQGARLVLETGTKDTHSGLTGGAARNAVGELAQVLSRCYDAATGRALIPGFYDDAAPLAADEVREFLASGFSVAEFQRAHGLRSLRTQDSESVVRRIWGEPTFEVHGIAGGYGGPGIKTIVPQRAEAKVSMRLVPNQEPTKMLRLLTAFVQSANPDVRVEDAGALPWYLGQRTGPYAEAARRAIAYGFGKSPAFVREGGSIGAVVAMERHLHAPVLLMGLSLPEHGYHAPNEYFDWGQAAGGIKAFVHFFAEAGGIGKRQEQ